MSKKIKIDNCIDCPHHEIQKDPDPYDSFCSDDIKVVCKNSACKEITCACRPYNVRKECKIPKWCELEDYNNEKI